MNEIILTSSVLILIIAALRHILRGRIAPTLQYTLWLLVAVRLLIPGTLFTAPVTVVGLADEIHGAVVENFTEDVPHVNESTAPIYIPEQNITFEPPSLTIPSDINNSNTAPTPPQSSPTLTNPKIDWLDVVWKTGIFIVGTAFLLSNLSFYRKLRRTRQRIDEDDLPIACPIPVYYVPKLDAPCLFGIKNAIYVNQTVMHPDRLRHVLTHELNHRRHGDHFWALLRCVCLSIHWYNPLVWWAAILSRRDCEISCDSAVISKLGISCDISYGETLMAMLTKSPANLLRTATTMSSNKRTMAERLHLIVHRPKMMKLTLAAVALVTIGAVILTFGGCADEVNNPNTDSAITDSTADDASGNEDQTSDDGKLIPPDDGFGYIPSPTYIHPSGLFTMEIPDNYSIVTVKSEDGVSFYDPAVYQNGSTDGWILSVQPQPADWNGYQNPTLTLAAFDPNGTPQVYVLEYSEAYEEQFTNLRDWITASFTLLATPEQFSRLIHDSYEDNIALAISYLPYLSWRNYKDVYGEDALMPLLGALWQFADSGKADWNQYHDMLSMTNDGLDGTYSEGLSSVFETLFSRNQEQFLSVVNSVYITDTERARVAAYVDYTTGSQPSESETEEVTYNDGQIQLSLSRSYGSTVWSIGSPENLTLTLTDDWTLGGIKAALFAAVSEHISGTLLEGDLVGIEIAYGFSFPDEMRDGVTLTVPFHAIYRDQDTHTLPSGEIFHCTGRTGELTATIRLVGEGTTAPVDEEFAHGQEIYDLLAQLVTVNEITASLQLEKFDLLDAIYAVITQQISDAGLNDICQMSSGSCGSHYNPLWCSVGYEQTVDYSITLLYREGEQQYQFTFQRTVTLKTTE